MRAAPSPMTRGRVLTCFVADDHPAIVEAVTRLCADGGELEVEVSKDLQVTLTGWARPVFSGELSEAFEKELHETE